MKETGWTNAYLPLLTLALRLEGEGQYNLAKLARAAVDSLGRRAAYESLQASPGKEMAEELEQVIDAISGLEVGKELLAALRNGAAALAENRLPMIRDTPHPYVCRTCGHLVEALDPPAALEKLRQTPLDVAALLDGLSEQVLAQEPPGGGWAIRNTITHMRDAQGVLDYRLELFSKERNPVLESKAVWSWAKAEDEHPPSTLEIFEEYKAMRGKILAWLEGLPLVDWWRTGSHEEFGTVTIKQQVSYFASHEITHLPQIARLVRRRYS